MQLFNALTRLFRTSSRKGGEKAAEFREKVTETLEGAVEAGKNAAEKFETASENIKEKAHEAVLKAKEFGAELVEKSEHMAEKLDERATHVVDKLESKIHGEEHKSQPGMPVVPPAIPNENGNSNRPPAESTDSSASPSK